MTGTRFVLAVALTVVVVTYATLVVVSPTAAQEAALGYIAAGVTLLVALRVARRRG